MDENATGTSAFIFNCFSRCLLLEVVFLFPHITGTTIILVFGSRINLMSEVKIGIVSFGFPFQEKSRMT